MQSPESLWILTSICDAFEACLWHTSESEIKVANTLLPTH